MGDGAINKYAVVFNEGTSRGQMTALADEVSKLNKKGFVTYVISPQKPNKHPAMFVSSKKDAVNMLKGLRSAIDDDDSLVVRIIGQNQPAAAGKSSYSRCFRFRVPSFLGHHNRLGSGTFSCSFRNSSTSVQNNARPSVAEELSKMERGLKVVQMMYDCARRKRDLIMVLHMSEKQARIENLITIAREQIARYKIGDIESKVKLDLTIQMLRERAEDLVKEACGEWR